MLYAIFLASILKSLVVEITAVPQFPDDFKFGTATASYQIEGGWNASGKGENIWDRMVHTHPERITDHTTGDIACDSYNRYLEDVGALIQLGVHYYRFSLSWSRILPTGFKHLVNPDGVQYYRKLLCALKFNKIEPVITLYHWDLPQPLQDLGGWTNPLMANYFEQYADVVFKLFAGDVKVWITFNEPGEVCETGYGSGVYAPNINMSGITDYMCGKTLLLAHARAYHLYKNKYQKRYKGEVGISISTPWYEPKVPRNTMISDQTLRMEFGWWANPIFSKTGDYPTIMKTRINSFSTHENFTESRLPPFSKSEVKYIRGTFDFLGLNHYTTHLVSVRELPPNGPPSREKDLGVLKEQSPTWENSSVPWLKVVPWGFRKILNWIRLEYNNPKIYVTENGFADYGEIQDKRRISYHITYLKEMLDAILEDGCNIQSYTIWSLMDNMEWTDGYTVKFGLFYINFNDTIVTARGRTPKMSVDFYKKLIKSKMIPDLSAFDAPADHVP